MGIFNLFGKKSSHEDDVLYLTFMIMWQMAHFDGDFNEDEEAWIKQWFTKHSPSKIMKLEKMIDKGFDPNEMERILKNCSPNEVAGLLAEAINVIAIDGVINEKELEALTILSNSIGLNIDDVRKSILAKNNIDIFNSKTKNPSNQDKDGRVKGFRSHHSD